jgi:hypothetical protein
VLSAPDCSGGRRERRARALVVRGPLAYRLRAMARSSCCLVMLERPSIFSRFAVL